VGARERQVLQVIVRQHHHVAGGELVPLGHVGVRHLLAVDRADALELNPPAVLFMHLTEGDITLLGR
jgi:hypothetical protein